MNKHDTLTNKLNHHLNLTKDENLNNTFNNLSPWIKYEFTRPDNRTYGTDYLIGQIELWLGSDPLETRYTALHLDHDNQEIVNLTFYELMDLLKEHLITTSYCSIYSADYQKIIHINDHGYYWKNF